MSEAVPDPDDAPSALVGSLDVTGLSQHEEQRSLIVAICTDPVSRLVADLNHTFATGIAQLARENPYTASVLLDMTEGDARRLGAMSPSEVRELAAATPFLVAATPVLPAMIDHVLSRAQDPGPALFRYATRPPAGSDDV